jgi:sec-independent protein translocase protein TatA
MELSPMHILLVLLIILVLFGGKKIPEVMRGLGQGVKEFKEGMRSSDAPPTSTQPPAHSQPTEQKK